MRGGGKKKEDEKNKAIPLIDPDYAYMVGGKEQHPVLPDCEPCYISRKATNPPGKAPGGQGNNTPPLCTFVTTAHMNPCFLSTDYPELNAAFGRPCRGHARGDGGDRDASPWPRGSASLSRRPRSS